VWGAAATTRTAAAFGERAQTGGMSAPWAVEQPIETERLRLRPHRMSDVDDLLRFHSDPEVVRYLPWPVRDRPAVLETLAVKVGQHRAEQPGDWLVLAIELRADADHPAAADRDRVIGEVLIKRAGEHDPADETELGFAIAREAWGGGLAGEAARAMLELAAGWGLHSAVAVVAPENEGSRRLVAKLGFEPDGTVVRRGLDLLRFRREL